MAKPPILPFNKLKKVVPRSEKKISAKQTRVEEERRQAELERKNEGALCALVLPVILIYKRHFHKIGRYKKIVHFSCLQTGGGLVLSPAF